MQAKKIGGSFLCVLFNFKFCNLEFCGFCIYRDIDR